MFCICGHTTLSHHPNRNELITAARRCQVADCYCQQFRSLLRLAKESE